MDYFFGSFGMVGVLFIIIVGLLWALLPFAIFGIKDRLDKQIERQDKQIEILHRIELLLMHKRD